MPQVAIGPSSSGFRSSLPLSEHFGRIHHHRESGIWDPLNNITATHLHPLHCIYIYSTAHDNQNTKEHERVKTSIHPNADTARLTPGPSFQPQEKECIPGPTSSARVGQERIAPVMLREASL
ncbi:hypothetical protein J6590_037064 [Homalodisca vitripennis]|nr:hypothetical protein J6590_037064 [Homalodisca vitripennis]